MLFALNIRKGVIVSHLTNIVELGSSPAKFLFPYYNIVIARIATTIAKTGNKVIFVMFR
jgi:hypothetical protein